MRWRAGSQITLLCLGLGWLAGNDAVGQTAVADSELALAPYRSNAGGFEIQLPVGWTYEYGDFGGPGGSRGLMRGGSLAERIAIQVLMFRDVDASDFNAWVDALAASVGGIEGVADVERGPAASVALPSATVLVRARIDIELVETVYTCVQFDAATVWVLSYGTARAAVEAEGVLAAPPLVDRILRSLRVFHDAGRAARIEQARRLGGDYLKQSLPSEIRRLRLDDQPRYYLIQQAGRDVGYVLRHFRPEKHSLDDPRLGRGEGNHGLRVTEQIWRFFDNDIVRYESNEVFSSVDGQSDLYEFTTSTTAPPDAPVQQPFVTRDECVRASMSLVTSYTTSRHVVLPNPRPPLKLRADYLGSAWVYALPGLLRGCGDALYAFSRYDHETRELLSYSIRCLGERPVPGSDSRGRAFEARDGVSDVTRLLFTDEYGNLLREEHGDRVLRLSDKATVEGRFAARRDAARARLSSSDP
jgi:hypothetical protein